MSDEKIAKLERDLEEVKKDVKGIFTIVSDLKAIHESMAALRRELNRVYNGHTEIFNRLRSLETEMAEKKTITDDIDEIKTGLKDLADSKISKSAFFIVSSLLGFIVLVATIVSIIIRGG